MIFLIVVLLLIVVFDIAALLWGYDSRDKINSKEWERRATQVLQVGHPAIRSFARAQAPKFARPSLQKAPVLQTYSI